MKHYNKLEITALHLIGVMPTCGYDLTKALGDVVGFTHKNAGAIHRSLRQMERDGLLTSEWDVPEAPLNGPARKIYSLTAAGKAYLDQHAQPAIDIGHVNKRGKRRP